MNPVIADTLASCIRLICGVQVRWVTPPTSGPCLYVANHTSHLDFLVIWSSLPPELRATVRPVAAADYWGARGIRSWIATRALNAVLIERGQPNQGKQQIARMAQALEAGASLILFPEGTRGRGPAMGSLKSGLYYLAREVPSVPLIPVALGNLHRMMPKGAHVPVPLLGRATFGTSFHLEPDEDKIVFMERVRQQIEGLANV